MSTALAIKHTHGPYDVRLATACIPTLTIEHAATSRITLSLRDYHQFERYSLQTLKRPF